MQWIIDRIFNYDKVKPWGGGYAHLGFYDHLGGLYVTDYWHNWAGSLENDRLLWTAGPQPVEGGCPHIEVDLSHPYYVASRSDGALLVCSTGNNRVYKLDPEKREASIFIDGDALGIKDIGNCEYDLDGNVWLCEVKGGKVWQFSRGGEPLIAVGNGESGFQRETVTWEKARFSWIYDLRRGPDGNMYVLDSKNYAVRMIDPKARTVSLVAGTGEGGYTGDGGDALAAQLGCSPEAFNGFDGPWSLTLDEAGNIYIGDTQNHVVRMVDRRSGIISTIAGRPDIEPGVRNDPSEKDPLSLNLPLICSLNYHHGRLLIPDWNGDLIVLIKREDL